MPSNSHRQWRKNWTEANQTWTLLSLSEVEPGYQPLRGKWGYKVKRDFNGDITRFKARWVVKIAFRILFAIAAYYYLDRDQMNVKTVFLYGLIDLMIYVEMRKGSCVQMVDMGLISFYLRLKVIRDRKKNENDIKGMTGFIMFFMVETTPDIPFAPSVVSCCAKKPSRTHTEVIRIRLKYLKATKDVVIVYGCGDLWVDWCSDFD